MQYLSSINLQRKLVDFKVKMPHFPYENEFGLCHYKHFFQTMQFILKKYLSYKNFLVCFVYALKKYGNFNIFGGNSFLTLYISLTQ